VEVGLRAAFLPGEGDGPRRPGGPYWDGTRFEWAPGTFGIVRLAVRAGHVRRQWTIASWIRADGGKRRLPGTRAGERLDQGGAGGRLEGFPPCWRTHGRPVYCEFYFHVTWLEVSFFSPPQI